MKVADVTVEGTTALLQHRFADGVLDGVGKGTRRMNLDANQDTPRDQAEKVAYRQKDGTLYLPGAAISRLLREAGSGHKMKGSRKSLKFLVPSATLVLDEAIPLHNGSPSNKLRDFEVDSRPVTIPATKGRIMRHRPRLDVWSASFSIRINDEILAPATVQQLLVEGGQQLGVGDFRPEKGGPFGTFRVTRWEER